MKIRKRKGRSAAVQDGRRRLLLVREYVNGYRRMPETAREVRAAEAAAIKLLASLPW
jgi:hypothetical protein